MGISAVKEVAGVYKSNVPKQHKTHHKEKKKKNKTNKMHSTAASFLTTALNTFSRVEQFPPALHVFSKTKMEI